MSLINQVLKDLDERRAVEYAEHKSELDDLHFVRTPKRKRISRPVIIGSSILVVIVAAALAGLYVYQQGKDTEQVSETSEDGVAQTIQAPRVQPTTVVNRPASVKQVVKPSTTGSLTSSHKPETSGQSAARAEPRQTASPKTARKHSADKKVVATAPEPVKKSDELTDVEDDHSPTQFERSVVPLRPEQKAELAYQNGYEQLKSRQYRKAEHSLRRALAIEQEHIKARELLSGLYIKQGRWVEASELLKQGVTYSPRHLTFAKLYARALMQLNRDQQAISVLKQHAPAIKNDPNYFAMLAALYQRQGQHQDAADEYARLVTINPQNGVWWVGLGISLEALGRTRDAVRAYGHARKTGNLHAEVAKFTNNRLLALDEIGFPSE
jgi:MSHA biogenesis protein MshN